ncbi:MAG: hypothetical protein DCC75_10425, partial [Proteobacteria bacterium]
RGDASKAGGAGAQGAGGAARDELTTTLKSLQDKITEQRSAALARRKAEKRPASAISQVVVADDQKERLRKEYEEAQRMMRSDIEGLHKTLKTEIEGSDLPKLREFMLGLAEQIKVGEDAEIEARVKGAALMAIIGQAGEHAWEMLNASMQQAGEEWPEPDGLPPNATKEQFALARERSLTDVRELFLGLPPQAIAELTIGVVPAWKISYPAKSSWLWRQVSLRGVAAGIQSSMTRSVVTELKSAGEALRSEILGLVTNELNTLNAAIAKGTHSLEEVDHMLRTARSAVEGLIKERVLEKAAPVFARYAV